MKVVQLTLNEELIEKVDHVVAKLGSTRSAFTRHALQDALKKIEVRELEIKHRKGYEKKPVRPTEFRVAERDLVWPDSAEDPNDEGEDWSKK